MHAQPNASLMQMWQDRLREVGYSQSAADLVAAADAAAPDARAIALALLGLGGHRSSLPTVLAHLGDDYPPARVEAARAAVLLGAAQGKDQLQKDLNSDWHESALNAAAYLADLGDAVGYPVIAAALQGGDALRLQAVLLLRSFLPFDGQLVSAERIGVAAALERAATSDPSALVRREAVYQAAHLDEAARRRILSRAATDPDDTVARAARNRMEGPVT